MVRAIDVTSEDLAKLLHQCAEFELYLVPSQHLHKSAYARAPRAFIAAITGSHSTIS